jgi:hypothetical protein
MFGFPTAMYRSAPCREPRLGSSRRRNHHVDPEMPALNSGFARALNASEGACPRAIAPPLSSATSVEAIPPPCGSTERGLKGEKDGSRDQAEEDYIDIARSCMTLFITYSLFP